MPTERFVLANRSGQRLVGLIDYPPGDAPIPAIFVACHGYGGDKNGRYLRVIATALNAAGLGVLRFDFTNGAGESDGTLAGASVAGYVSDLEDVLDFLRQQPRLATSRISVGGHSYAGRVALVAAARRPTIDAVFFLSALYASDEFVMADIVAAIGAPIFIVHGSADHEVALHHAETLAQVAGAKVGARLTIAGADHNYTVPGSAATVAAFIRQALEDRLSG